MKSTPRDRYGYLFAASLSLLSLCFANPLSAANIEITGFTDGTGACVTGGDPVSCPSLRSAILFANNTPGADSVTLQAGEYLLSINGVDETWSGSGAEGDPFVPSITPDTARGDLDITETITITGAVDVQARLLTTIRWDEQSFSDPAVGDRIFHVQAPTGGAPITASFSHLILTDGSVGIVPNTDPAALNAYDIEVINSTAGATVIRQFRRLGGAVAVGSGAAVVVYEEANHGPAADRGDGAPMGPFAGGPGDPGVAGTIDSVTLHRVAVVGNFSGADGGGIYSAAPMAIRQSVISGNSSGRNGGGIYSEAEITMSETTVGMASTVPFLADASLTAEGNTATNGGGLFDTGLHTTTITRSSINGNTAFYGGAIVGHGMVRFNMNNTTISGNLAIIGAGITSNGASTIINSTISNNNNAVNSGGAGVNTYGSGSFTLGNTILSINELPNGEYANCNCGHGNTNCPQIISLGYNLESCQSCAFVFTGTDRRDTFPLLKPLANNGGLTETHALPHTTAGDAQDSPAVDTGDAANCPGADQRGVVRPVDGNLDGGFVCDVGAFELTADTADLRIATIYASADRVGLNEPVSISAGIVHPAMATLPAENVAVTAALPAGLNVISAMLNDGAASQACTASANVLTCPAIAALAPGQQATLTLETTAAAQGTHPVVVSVASTGDPVVENNTARVEITVAGTSDLALAVTADNANVATGSNVTITVTASNNGPDYATGVRFSGPLPGGFQLVSATPSAGTCSGANATIECNFGSLAPAAAATATIVLRSLQAGAFNLGGLIVADQDDRAPANNSASVAITASGDTVVINPTPASGGGGSGGGGSSPDLPLALTALALYWWTRGRSGR